jgi:hypothetical protein
MVKNINEIKAVMDVFLTMPVSFDLFQEWYLNRNSTVQHMLTQHIRYNLKPELDHNNPDWVIKAFWELKPSDITIQSDREFKLNHILAK